MKVDAGYQLGGNLIYYGQKKFSQETDALKAKNERKTYDYRFNIVLFYIDSVIAFWSGD